MLLCWAICECGYAECLHVLYLYANYRKYCHDTAYKYAEYRKSPLCWESICDAEWHYAECHSDPITDSFSAENWIKELLKSLFFLFALSLSHLALHFVIYFHFPPSRLILNYLDQMSHIKYYARLVSSIWSTCPMPLSSNHL